MTGILLVNQVVHSRWQEEIVGGSQAGHLSDAGVLAFDLVVKGASVRKTSAWKRVSEPSRFWRWFGFN